MRYRFLVITLILAAILCTGCNKSTRAYKSELKRLKELASDGDPVYLDSLAMHMIAQGESKAIAEANKLLEQAAAKGYHKAMYNLAVGTRNSWDVDSKKAYYWMNLACAYCPQGFYERYAKKRDEYRTKLKDDEVKSAQAQALLFYEKIEKNLKPQK